MKRIGLTGGIGSGKSIICEVLKVMGYPVFNSDEEAKQLMIKDQKVIQAIKNVFGEAAYNNNQLNRPFLANQIFNDESLKTALNNIVHPAVRKAFDDWALKQSEDLVFNEAAILFETGAYKTFDHTVLVTAPEDLRVIRVTTRDQTTAKEVRQRMSNQWKDEEKKELASFVIVNDDETLVTPQVIEMVGVLSGKI